MNTRLLELYYQAFELGTSGYSNGELDVEKFAQLIVAECIQVVRENTASPNGYQALEKHFGVDK